MTSIVCFGDLMVDVLALLPGPLAVGSDTPAPITTSGGGAAANVACWSAALGAAATFVGRVGADPLGRRAVEDLTTLGVDVRVETDDHLATGICIVLVDPTGERTMVPAAGANAAPLGRDLLPETADWLYVSGYALLNERSRPTALEALSTARARGWAVAVDPASAAPLASVGADTFLQWLGSDMVLLSNADEARVLTGEPDLLVAAQLLAARVDSAVVKMGAGGAVWSDGERLVTVPGIPVSPVDTTGAGDAFAAGFLCARGTVTERLTAAAEVAARAVTQVGARPSAPIGGAAPP